MFREGNVSRLNELDFVLAIFFTETWTLFPKIFRDKVGVVPSVRLLERGREKRNSTHAEQL